jgi:outer membrane biosynthesis protein TonB
VPNVQAPDGTVVSFPDSMSTDDIASVMQKQFPPTGGDSSYGADIRQGAHDAMTNLGNAGQAIGSGLADIGLPTAGGYASAAGQWAKANAPDAPAHYQPRSANIMSDIHTGNYRQAAGDVLHGLAQNAAPAGAALGAGMAATAVAPEALAGAAGAAGAGLVGGAMGLGEGAGESAAQAGRTTPNTADLKAGLPKAALGAATSATGLGRAIPGGIVGRTLAGAGASAASAAGNAMLDGRPIDGDQIANAAIIGGAGAGAAELPGMVRTGVKTATDRAMAATLPTPNTDDALAQIGLRGDADATGISTRTRAYNNTKANYKIELRDALGNVADNALANGATPQDVRMGTRRAQTIITDIAGRHNNEMTLQDALGLQDALSWADPQHVDAILAGTRALNAGSDQSIIKNQVGPFQKTLGTAARYGGIAYELAQGNPMAALAAVGLGHSPIGSMASRVGQGVGLGLDKLFGTATPVNDLRAIKAAGALRSVGIDPTQVASPLQGLRDLNAQFASPQRVTGLGPTPIPVNTPIPPSPQPAPQPSPAPRPAPSPQPTPQPAPQPSPPPQPAPQPSPATAAAIQQAQALGPTQRLQQAQALVGARPPTAAPQSPPSAPQASPPPSAPARPPLAPTASQGASTGTPAWLRYLANGRPDVDMQMAMQATQAAEQAGHVLPGTAASLAGHLGGYDAAQLQAIQQHLPPIAGGPPPAAAGGGNRWQWSDASVRDYHFHADAAAKQAEDVGLQDVANAIRDIAVNHHSQEAKANARSTLPPEVAQRVPQWLVNHGPRKDHVSRRP